VEGNLVPRSSQPRYQAAKVLHDEAHIHRVGVFGGSQYERSCRVLQQLGADDRAELQPVHPQGNGTFGPAYTRRIRAMRIRDHQTAPRSPWQNGHVERLIGSIRRESLDHLIVFGGGRTCAASSRLTLRITTAFDNPVWPTLILRFGPPSLSLILLFLRDFNCSILSPVRARCCAQHVPCAIRVTSALPHNWHLAISFLRCRRGGGHVGHGSSAFAFFEGSAER